MAPRESSSTPTSSPSNERIPIANDPSPDASLPDKIEQEHHFTTDVPSSTHILFPTRVSDDFIRTFSGAVSGIASGVITCPLDVIKTKLQARGGFRALANAPPTVGYKGFIGSGRMKWRDEGIRGLYRGLGPIVLGYLPTWAVYFTVYERCKMLFREADVQKDGWVTHLMSAIIAGGCSTIATNPIWVIKTRLMTQSQPTADGKLRTPWHYTSTIDAARKMFKQEGLRSYYSGLGPALLGLTHVAVQFPLYESFKRSLHCTTEDGNPNVGRLLAATTLSKLVASCVTYPHEVVRTRMQTQHRPNGGGKDLGDLSKVPKQELRYRGLSQTIARIYREEGWRAFYVGMGTNMVRSIPASCVTFITYEVVSSTLLQWKKQSVEVKERKARGKA